MELSAAQCSVIAQTIPVLLLAFTVEQRFAPNRRLIALARWINALGLVALLAGWLIAFLGLDNGVHGFAGSVALYSTIGGLTVLVSVVLSDLLLPPVRE
ncbi:hypothetical protein [Pimelobacter simplex]|uniref:hypothetical protein n=1 Tax=Nocardioides simplex TaxID=2045 RepID=UPI0021505511|nr:hypothetical protein [Pimelobacter simplex]UUW88351.1 hypothetical protein M0M43_21765 [Pimelobacter simplex]UUW97855.1 hypothetical protein M0M48_10410 [Pimelobacter simplex]